MSTLYVSQKFENKLENQQQDGALLRNYRYLFKYQWYALEYWEMLKKREENITIPKVIILRLLFYF